MKPLPLASKAIFVVDDLFVPELDIAPTLGPYTLIADTVTVGCALIAVGNGAAALKIVVASENPVQKYHIPYPYGT